jgi:hypothetical protein
MLAFSGLEVFSNELSPRKLIACAHASPSCIWMGTGTRNPALHPVSTS